MNDLVGGHVQMFFDLLPASLQQINGGKVRALANAGAKRPFALPNLPTVAEQGLAGFEASSWFGFVAPAKTPAPVVARLAEETEKILKTSGDGRAHSRARLRARHGVPRQVRRLHAGRRRNGAS